MLRVAYIFNRQWLRPVKVSGVWIAPRAVGCIAVESGEFLVLPEKAEFLGLSPDPTATAGPRRQASALSDLSRAQDESR